MERNVHYQIVSSILKSPHREVDVLLPIHKEVRELDPLFYTKMGIWYKDHGSIRDHAKLFTGGVLTSPLVEFRPVAYHLLVDSNPKLFHDTVMLIYNKWGGKTGGKFRRLRKIVEEYLRKEENLAEKDNGRRFLRNATFFRELYRVFHIRPNPRAAKSLRFRASSDVEPYLAFIALKEVAKSKDEEKICTIIQELKLPPLQVIGAVKELTPAIAATLLDTMSPAEVINFTKFFERKGLFKYPEFLEAYKKKTKKKSKTASLRAKKAAEAVDVDISDVVDSIVEKLDPIEKRIALCIDRSFSMTDAIILGKEVATILASKVVKPRENLLILLLNDHVERLRLPRELTYTGFDIAFRYINAVGTTSLGLGIKAIEKLNFNPDVVLYITDGGENIPPYLHKELGRTNLSFKLITCYIGENIKELNLPDYGDKGIEMESFVYDADYYALPNLIKLISSGGLRELVEEINEIDLSKYISIETYAEALEV